jgi:hypothetical protein
MYETQFNIGKHQFTVSLVPEEEYRAPWDDDCIFDGVVSAAPRRSGWPRTCGDKRPYQRIFYVGRGNDAYLFDVQQYIKVARSHGCTGKQAHEQCLASFERLRQWGNDAWSYVGVIVARVDSEGEELESDSLWGIESDCDDYIAEVARDMADQMVRAQNKARYAARKESQERRYWAARDVVTI